MKIVFKTTTLLLTACGLAACTGSSSSDPASTVAALSVSGSLSLSSSRMNLGPRGEDGNSALALSDYTAVCLTSTTPVVTGSAAVAADGTFNISIAGGASKPLSCSLVDASGVKQADFLISDSTKHDMNGNDETTNTATFSADAALGTVTFDANAGEVTVPKANIASVMQTTVASNVTVFDPTGSWTIGAVDFTVPTGVKAPCTARSCNGPPSGQSIYLKLFKGLQASDSSSVYGLQVWDSVTSFTACGGKIGLSSAQKTDLGITFPDNAADDSVFSFSTSVANFPDQMNSGTPTNVTLTDNWKMDIATASHDMMTACSPRDFTVGGTTYSNAWTCGPDSSNRYMVNFAGGCQTTTGATPVQVTDWTAINSCGSTTDADGIQTQTCTGNATINSVATPVTCIQKFAYTDNTYAIQPAGGFTWADLNASKVASGALCSGIANGASSEALKIAQLQCYAEYFYQSGMSRYGSACLPKVDTDWTSTTSAGFAKVDFRPNQLVFFEQYKPFTDGTGGSILTRQEHYEGVQVNGNNYVNCRVIETGGLTFKKITDNKLLATYQSSTITTSLSKPACLANFTGARESFMFYLTK